MAGNLVSERGAQLQSQFYHLNDGFYYYKYKQVGLKSYFRCIVRSCNALGVLGLQFQQTNGHNHQPCLQYAQYLRERRALLDEASASTALPLRIAFDSERSSNSEFAEYLSYESLRPALRRARFRLYPDVPTSLMLLDEILVNPSYSSLCSIMGRDSLYRGSLASPEGSHIILLLSKRCMDMMKLVPCLHTFNISVPIRDSENSCQVHVIGTTLGNTAVALACVLLETFTLDALVTGLSHLQHQLSTWNFKTVVAYDGGVEAEAYQRVFGIRVDFPYNQYLQDIGHLSKQLLENQDLNSASDIITLCSGLPTVPEDYLMRAMAIIKGQVEHKEDRMRQAMTLLLLNIEMHWTHSVQRGLKFSMCGNTDRTSNFIESMEARLKPKLVLANGTNYYGILCVFKDVENTSFTDIVQLNAGKQTGFSRRVTSLSQDRQIVQLTKALTQSGPANFDSALVNLLFQAGAKKQHILTRAMEAT